MENVPPSPSTAPLALVLYYLFKLAQLLLAAFIVYLGFRLFILGVTGQASLSIESKTVGGQLLNGAPGLFFAVGGIVLGILLCLKRSRYVPHRWRL